MGVWPTLFGSVGALVTTFLVIPIVARMSKTLGKKRAFHHLAEYLHHVGYVMLVVLDGSRQTVPLLIRTDRSTHSVSVACLPS